MASKKQAAKGAFWATVERAATQGISLVVVLILARLLGPENYGMVTLAATIALLGQTLLGETFSQAIIQTKTLEEEHVSSLFWVLFGTGLFAGGALFVAAGGLANLFALPALAPILRALTPLLVLTSLQAIPAALFKRDLDFRALAAASMGGTLLGGAAGVGLAFAGFGLWSLVANLLVQNTLVTAAIWRQSRFRPGFLYSHRHLKELWSYGQYTFFLRIAAFTANQSPRILIGYLFGAAALGSFSLGLRIVEIMYQLLSLPAANVLLPVIAKVRHDPKKLEHAILGSTLLAAMMSVPAFVGLALIAPTAVPLLFGLHWAQSSIIVQILAAYGIIVSSGLIWGSVVAGIGRPDINLAVTTMAAIVSVGLLLIMAPWGLVAAAIAFVLRGYVASPTFPFIISRLTGITLFKQASVYGPVLAAAAAMAVVVETVIQTLGPMLTPFELTAAAILCGAATYALALYLLARPALRLGVSILSELIPRQKTA
jgi:O-antigen/teichoic acid export membrane protein